MNETRPPEIRPGMKLADLAAVVAAVALVMALGRVAPGLAVYAWFGIGFVCVARYAPSRPVHGVPVNEWLVGALVLGLIVVVSGPSWERRTSCGNVPAPGSLSAGVAGGDPSGPWVNACPAPASSPVRPPSPWPEPRPPR
jgi:hypothetical protein